MRILITGSSGQIGTNLGLYLQNQGHQVFGLDKRPNIWTDQIETISQDLSIPYKDFAGGIGDYKYPPDLDVVVHLAAHAKVHELVKHPDRALENIIMIYNVLEFCRQKGLPIIFGSSRETYGNLKHDKETTSEEMADFTLAASPYSASKISGEAMIYAYAHCYDLLYLVFRFSNVYGRFDNDIERMERVIPLFIHKISHHEPITIYGRDKMLDFTYIDDCIDGIARGIDSLVRGEVVNQTINLAYGQGNSLVQMAEYIGEALGIEPKMTIEPSLRGEVTYYIADISKAKTLLGYDPTTPLREGIRKAVAWSKDWGKRDR
jgi:nucleoside-diphosphate-sugar epimerase